MRLEGVDRADAAGLVPGMTPSPRPMTRFETFAARAMTVATLAFAVLGAVELAEKWASHTSPQVVYIKR